MKIILEFNLPDEQVQFKHAHCGQDYFCALHDLSQKIRRLYKYGEQDYIEVEEMRDTFYAVLNEYNISLEQ